MAVADIFTIALFGLAALFNRQTVILLLAALVWELLFLLPINDFWMNIISAILYALTASIFIKLKSNVRYALLCISGLYYLGAVDYYLADGVETLYYHSMSYFIIAAELYAVWQLLGRERSDGRICSIVNRRFFYL